MKFHTHFRFHKDKKVIPPGKSLIFQKKLEIFLKIRFLEFFPLVYYFWIYMMHRSWLYDSAKTACFEKTSFSSYMQNYSQTIKLQDFSSLNFTRTI